MRTEEAINTKIGELEVEKRKRENKDIRGSYELSQKALKWVLEERKGII